ncbi:ABC transporter ATP-binding protein [Nocardioides daejeonensis]|uniref:ABC transporter ATP-binding protein n=1 Tax=Nocardioides daejeonensis TaxID=1046556 RepID=UPI000D7489E7|nr:ABC transporter ATP-binding protein [Nocardioides daejeonensis]
MSDTLTPVNVSTPLRLREVTAGYGSRTILHGLDIEVPVGRFTSVIGPNGCGKSTTLRVMARLLSPDSGDVLWHGRPVADLKPRELATQLAMLPQVPVAPEGMTVEDLVAMGRQPHQPWWRAWSAEDDRIVAEAMAATAIADLAERPLDELSGGQRQRAWIAMTLAQQTELLLLDEPTTHLDLAHAVEVLDLVCRLRDDTGRTVVAVLHDLSLAARYSDHLVVLKDGRLVTAGAPREVLTPELLLDTFGLRAHVFDDPVEGRPVVVPVGHG